ncbi:granule-bound starch synthase 1, chloroplastic/amyloplastic-like [Nymphaea colorata]|nr:granule-bound starch synthase 1, chloroplastic/amyloplastic-like [Nymphaea colorata]XP_031496070.1 granule-bound starch synthase 1, chloroplastic/amyloplastic-like [Nymphaea colorata]XP_031496071.1 granule-bound starch synthase 1, chloroplastic/amyloplastic-like [Nymphaea colorata]
MATLNATHLVSGASHFISSGACDSETVPFANNVAVRRSLLQNHQLKSYNGLRSSSIADSLACTKAISNHAARTGFKQEGVRTNGAKAMSNQSERTGFKQEVVRTDGAIECNKSGMTVVLVTAEVGPWSKTGGLGDVLSGLPPALAARGNRVMTVAPRYDQYRDGWDTSVLVELKVGDRIETVRFFHCYKRGVDRIFVDHPMFLEKVWGKTSGKIYGPKTGEDYKDNQLRFSLLCLAALEAPRILNLTNKYFSGPYGEDVVFVANDWHTALLPCYLKSVYQSKGMYTNAKVAFCIHNMAYQGRFAFADFRLLNLPDHFRSSFDFMDGYKKPVVGRKINWMKAGILESDIVLTVSPYYALEIISGAAKGVELDHILRTVKLLGIVNGMDAIEWNPRMDKYIDLNYDDTTVSKAKPILKEALQAAVGLPVDRNVPLFAFVGRLEEQKGSDILAAAVPEFIGENIQLIALGTGKKHMEKQLEELEVLYPDKARGVAKFNVPLAHKIMAGADFILIPSRFEPCGLVQLQAMPYGTPCLVTTTGGLADTVKDGFTGFQMGDFNVECDAVDPADVKAVVATVKRALAVYGTPAHKEMIKNCMAQDFSWKGPAKVWEDTLLSLQVAGSEPGFEGEEIEPLAKHNVATP